MAYIPEEHRKYNILPSCRKSGGEVFDYPSLQRLEELLSDYNLVIEPYGYKFYESYFSFLEGIKKKYGKKIPELVNAVDEYAEQLRELNIKEQWSICRYIGEDSDGDLTKGQCYYWPTSVSNPEYRGVIDDEEFTTYQYCTNADSWEILEDPTGMAKKAIENNVGMSIEIHPEFVVKDTEDN